MEYELIKHLEGTGLKLFFVMINQRELHFHGDVELLILLEGSLSIDDGRQRHLLRQDDIFLINKNEIHSLKRTDDNNVVLAIQFDPNLCKPYYPQITRVRFQKKHITKAEQGEYWKQLRGGLMDLVRCYAGKQDGYSVEMVGILNHLLYTMIRCDAYTLLDEKTLAAESRNMKRLSRIVEYMRQNFMYRITLKDLARQEKLDMYYLSHFVKTHLGISFQNYLNRLRVEKAEQLLELTDLNSIDICMECGFSDYKYLNKAFLKEFGCTPQEYRKRRREHSGATFPKESNAQHVVMQTEEAFTALRQYMDRMDGK